METINSFPWALIPGMVVAGILVKEGGFGSIGAFIDETLDYLEDKGGYVITEEQLKGLAGQEPEIDVKGIDNAFDRCHLFFPPRVPLQEMNENFHPSPFSVKNQQPLCLCSRLCSRWYGLCRPKRAISSQSIWLLISMMIAAPVLAWIQV